MGIVMTEHKAASFLPAPLRRILVATVPIVIVCFFASGLHDQHAAASAMTPEAIAARLQPVAHLELANESAAASKDAAPLKGQAVYEATCIACHGEGIAGAPKFGDKAAWAPRIAHGYNTLVKHAIEGFSGKSGAMPPKGGGSYEDVEVARAVAYMADKAGASFPEPVTLAKK
jgi:cytochrome c5